MIAELKFITAGPTRYGRDVATSLRAALNKREQQLYQEYLTRLRLKDRKYFHTPAGTVGPLERGLMKAKATNSGENFEGWVEEFYSIEIRFRCVEKLSVFQTEPGRVFLI